MSTTHEEMLCKRVERLENETQLLFQVAAVSVARLEWLKDIFAEIAPPESVAALELSELRNFFDVTDMRDQDSPVVRRGLEVMGLAAPDFVPETFTSPPVYREWEP